MKKISNEFKIGFFVVVALCVGFFMWVKTQKFTGGTYNIKTYFTYANNLKENAVVTVSGIEAGRVDKINFIYDPETKVEAVLAIKSHIKIHSDAIAYIDMSGLVGDVLLGITPGTSTFPFVKEGDIIASEDPIQTRELMKKAETIAAELDETLIDVKQIARNLNLAISDNKSSIDNIVKNLEQTAVNFNEFSEDIKKHPWKLLIKSKK